LSSLPLKNPVTEEKGGKKKKERGKFLKGGGGGEKAIVNCALNTFVNVLHRKRRTGS